MRVRNLVRAFIALSGAAGMFATVAQAEPTFSVDFQGPTATAPVLDGFFGVPITEGDILTNTPPGPPGPNAPALGPLPPPGIEVGAVPGAVGAVPGGLGIIPPLLELDALSYGRDAGRTLYFSVEEFAIGLPGSPLLPNVLSEGAAGTLEASADVFLYLGPLALTLPGPPLGNTQSFDGDGLAPTGLPGVGLIEPNPPVIGIPDAGDNLDAVDVNTSFGDLAGPIYFSLDSAFVDPLGDPPANTGTALAMGFSGADVLVSFPGGVPAVAIPAALLGLDLAGIGTDDLDALIFDDVDSSMSLTPADTLYFSVRRGSAVIGVPDSTFGVPIEAGDVLSPGGPVVPPGIFIAAEALGLATVRSGTAAPLLLSPLDGGDELDALDVLPACLSPFVSHCDIPALGEWGYAVLVSLLLIGTTLWLGTQRVRMRGSEGGVSSTGC